MSQTIPGFVGAADLIAQANSTEKWLKTEAKRSRRSRNGWRTYSLMVTALLAMSVSALDYAVPNIRLQPVLLWTSPDGVTGAAVTTDSMPADLSDASVKAWLWQYIMHREGYSWVEADYNHYVVEAMSGRACSRCLRSLDRHEEQRLVPEQVRQSLHGARSTA